MSFLPQRRWIASLLLLAAMAGCARADDESEKTPTQNPAAQSPATQDPATQSPAAEDPPADEVDPLLVPDGTPQELLAYIEDVLGRQAPGTDLESVQAFRKRLYGSVVGAAGKILAHQPTASQAQAAARWKVVSLSELKRLGDTEAGKRLAEVPGELAKAGYKELAREIRGFLLQGRLRDALMADRQELQTLSAEIQQFLAESPPGQNDVALAMRFTQVLEMGGNTELAAAAYRSFAKILSASDDDKTATLGAKMQGAARRLELPGKKMKLEGTFLDGKSLDWADYRGKVVLVQFWATWCGPCREELVSIRADYKTFHDRGFEVVAVSCDDDREKLEEFLKENELPWKSLFSSDPDATGMDHPMATYYGVMGIPTLILVGPDGNVVSLAVRGAKLRRELERLLGPVEEDGEK